jgi:hypothetical protein
MTEKPPLSRYVIAVVVVWAVVLGLMWLAKDRARFNLVAAFCAGFFAGMVAMFMAVHLYRF